MSPVIRHLLTLGIPADTAMQAIMHDDKTGQWYATQALPADNTRITRCDPAGKRIDAATWVGAGHGTASAFTTRSDGKPLIWTWWAGAPVKVVYSGHPKTTYHRTSTTITGLPRADAGYTNFQIDQATGLVVTRTSSAAKETYRVRALDGYGPKAKVLHTVTTGGQNTIGAWQGMALDGNTALYIVRGGGSGDPPILHRHDLASGAHQQWDVTHATDGIRVTPGHNEPEGLTMATIGGHRVLILAMCTGHTYTTNRNDLFAVTF